MKKIAAITIVVMCAGLSYAQRITESALPGNWTLGTNQPEVVNTIQPRGDGTTGYYHYLPVGTSPYSYAVQNAGVGLIEMWIYDPGNCIDATADHGYPARGPKWGMLSPTYQGCAVGIDRASQVSYCAGYSQWSTVSPYSPWWFKDGLRNTHGVAWTPGWYRWIFTAGMDNITMTLCNVTFYMVDGPNRGTPVTGDCSQTYDAISMTDWATLFGSGWQGVWITGDATGGCEDVSMDVTNGTGAFAEMNPGEGTTIGVKHPMHVTTWGNIKAMYSSVPKK